jgi:signal transduction histidine kinase
MHYIDTVSITLPKRTRSVLIFFILVPVLIASVIIIHRLEMNRIARRNFEVAGSLSRPLWNYNVATMELILHQQIRWNSFEYLSVIDADGQIIAALSRAALDSGNMPHMGLTLPIKRTLPIIFREESIGELRLTYRSSIVLIVSFAVLLEIMLAALGWLVLTLRRRNSILRKTLGEIIRLQDELIESRKHAAIGSLLKGMAHEMNTPLGNAMMLNSLLENLSGRVRIDQDPGRLRENALRFGEVSAELTLALDRISKLITRFRQLEIAADASDKQEYQLSEIISEAWYACRQEMPVDDDQLYLDVNCEQRIRGSRTVLLTIFTELIRNSIQHAFIYGEGESNNRILITCSPTEEGLSLVFEDNGLAVPAELTETMFEPFTRAGRTGSSVGIGLHIVRYLLTSFLAGTISYKRVDNSNRFSIRMSGQEETPELSEINSL